MDQTKIWEYFQNHGETGGSFDNAKPRYEFLARRVAPGSHALNVGVGRGGLEDLLIKKGVVVSCLDPSESSIERIRREHGIGHRAQVGHSQAMPFADNQFDVVIMSEVLEHLISNDLITTLGEVRRVLKPHGLFVGTVPANENLADYHVVCPKCGEAFHRWGHVQSFSVDRMRDVLVEHHFAVRKIYVRAFPSWRRNGLNNLVKSLIRYVLGKMGSPIASPNIYFEASRPESSLRKGKVCVDC